jgi:predicted acyltransferase
MKSAAAIPGAQPDSLLKDGTGASQPAQAIGEPDVSLAASPLIRQAATPSRTERIVSLDQFRGYTVAGMLLVNFVGGFAACSQVLKHSHDYFSYADTIMPQFLFAVGFAFRLTFGRRAELQGTAAAYGRVVRRMLGLALVSLVVYTVSPRAASWQALTEMSLWDVLHEPLKRNWFQTLMHIAVTGLWLVPVIRAGAAVRVIWMLASAAAHVALSGWFNFEWVNSPPNAIDGGPLAFLTWIIPATVGTLACDAVATSSGRPRLGRMLAWASALMVLGYFFSCGTRFYDVPAAQGEGFRGRRLSEHPVWPSREAIEAKLQKGKITELLAEPPFVAPPGADVRQWNYWMMSQRSGTVSYLTFAAGFSLALYVLFFIACDLYGLELAFFRTFGTNALLAYIVHDLVDAAVSPFIPKDAPGWYVTGGVLLFFAITWLFIRHFEKRGVYLRV